MADQHRSHYVLSFDALMGFLGLPKSDGVMRVWAEVDTDYLHILVDDPAASPSWPGSYVEATYIHHVTETEG